MQQVPLDMTHEKHAFNALTDVDGHCAVRHRTPVHAACARNNKKLLLLPTASPLSELTVHIPAERSNTAITE